MLESVDVGTQRISTYEAPYGGGFAQVLRSEIPILRDLGVVADCSCQTATDMRLEETSRTLRRT